MNLRTKLMSSYIGIASLIFAIGVFGIISSNQVTNTFETITNGVNPAITALGQISTQGSLLQDSAIRHALQRILKLPSTNGETFASAQNDLGDWLSKYQALAENQKFYDQIAAAESDLVTKTSDLVQLAGTSDAQTSDITDQIAAVDSAGNAFDDTVSQALDAENTLFNQQLTSAQTTAASTRTVYLIAMIVTIGGALLLGRTVSDNILRPIHSLQKTTEHLLHGDYSQRTQVITQDEIGQLATAFNGMAEAVEKRDSDLNLAKQMLEKRVEARTKELRLATREAQEASRLKDEFLSIMSHELRTPLNAILGFQGILLLSGNLDDRVHHMIERAQSNAERLLTLINDILDVSRIESGRLQLVPTEVLLAPLAEKLESEMSILADEKQVDFIVHIDPSAPPSITVDEDAITKIITNLLGNAFKFTSEGSVSLIMRRVDEGLQIEVTDTGAGIPSHLHQAIFERFRQVDGSTKRAYGGSGLGLAIVQKLCIALGGTVQVQSIVGKGSTFTVILPIEAERERVSS